MKLLKFYQILTIKIEIAEITSTTVVKNELNKFKEIKKTVDREIIVYIKNEYTYDFRNFQTINTFGREICNGKITFKESY